MLKRSIGIGCGVMATLCVAHVMPSTNYNINGVQVASAEEACTTAEECDEQINAARIRISDANSEREAAENVLSVVEDDLTEVLDRIDATEATIEKLETQVEEIKTSIHNHKEELAQLDEEVEELQELIGYRLRLAQRMNNSNEVLDFLTESETVVDFIRRVRVINHLSKTDAELMEELNTLIERQQVILQTLQDEQLALTAKTEELEAEKVILADNQKQLEERMKSLAKQIQASENTILDEEEALRIAEEQKRVLEQTPPPAVFTTNDSDNSSNSGSSAESGAGSGAGSSAESGAGSINGAGVENGGFIRPVSSGVITCRWGCYTSPTFHNGIDIQSTDRSAVPILAAATGVVTTSGWHAAYGNWVVIQHNINGEAYGTVYAHMRDTPIVSVGDTVSQGQQLGNMGSTGNSTGIHLHFEIHPGGWRWGAAVNPERYLDFPSRW